MDVIKPVLVVFECSKDPFGFELDQLDHAWKDEKKGNMFFFELR